jgi:hypothetical protein
MELITATELFRAAQQVLSSVVAERRRLPDQVFEKEFQRYYLIDFDEIYTRAFFGRILKMNAQFGGGPFYFSVIDPDPRHYFFQLFGKYSLLRIEPADSADEFIRKLGEDPGGSPADAILHNSNIVAFFPLSGVWAVYGDRQLGVAIVALASGASMLDFGSFYPTERLFSVEEAINDLMHDAYPRGVPDSFRSKFRRNYGIARVVR